MNDTPSTKLDLRGPGAPEGRALNGAVLGKLLKDAQVRSIRDLATRADIHRDTAKKVLVDAGVIAGDADGGGYRDDNIKKLAAFLGVAPEDLFAAAPTMPGEGPGATAGVAQPASQDPVVAETTDAAAVLVPVEPPPEGSAANPVLPDAAFLSDEAKAESAAPPTPAPDGESASPKPAAPITPASPAAPPPTPDEAPAAESTAAPESVSAPAEQMPHAPLGALERDTTHTTPPEPPEPVLPPEGAPASASTAEPAPLPGMPSADPEASTAERAPSPTADHKHATDRGDAARHAPLTPQKAPRVKKPPKPAPRKTPPPRPDRATHEETQQPAPQLPPPLDLPTVPTVSDDRTDPPPRQDAPPAGRPMRPPPPAPQQAPQTPHTPTTPRMPDGDVPSQDAPRPRAPSASAPTPEDAPLGDVAEPHDLAPPTPRLAPSPAGSAERGPVGAKHSSIHDLEASEPEEAPNDAEHAMGNPPNDDLDPFEDDYDAPALDGAVPQLRFEAQEEVEFLHEERPSRHSPVLQPGFTRNDLIPASGGSRPARASTNLKIVEPGGVIRHKFVTGTPAEVVAAEREHLAQLEQVERMKRQPELEDARRQIASLTQALAIAQAAAALQPGPREGPQNQATAPQGQVLAHERQRMQWRWTAIGAGAAALLLALVVIVQAVRYARLDRAATALIDASKNTPAEPAPPPTMLPQYPLVYPEGTYDVGGTPQVATGLRVLLGPEAPSATAMWRRQELPAGPFSHVDWLWAYHNGSNTGWLLGARLHLREPAPLTEGALAALVASAKGLGLPDINRPFTHTTNLYQRILEPTGLGMPVGEAYP